MKRRREKESGFVLLVVLLMSAGVALMLYRQLPRVAFESMRAKEEMLIERGEQYTRAIQLYIVKNRKYPQSIDDLDKGMGTRFLRRRYKDPFTGKDDWKLLQVDAMGNITNSKIKKKEEKKENQNTFITEFAGLGESSVPGQAGVNVALRRRPSEGGATDGSAPPLPLPSTAPDPYAQNQQQVPSPFAQPQQNQQGIDPATGQPQINPVTGQPYPAGQTQINPATGQPYPQGQAQINPATGQPYPQGQAQINPATGQPYPQGQAQINPATGQPYPQGQAQINPATGQPYPPGQAQINPATGQPYPQALQNPAPGQPGLPINPATGQPFQPVPINPATGQPYPFGQQQGQQVQQGQPNMQQMYPNGVPQFPGAVGVGQQGSPQSTYPTAAVGQDGRPVMGNNAPNAALDMIRKALTSPSPNIPMNMGPGLQLGPGLAGVASKYEAAAIKIYNEQQEYDKWEFIYDPRKDKRVQQQLGQMGVQPQPGMNPQQVGTPMGGTPMGAPPMGVPPMGGTPMGGTPMGGTPMGGTPMGGSPMGGRPMGGGIGFSGGMQQPPSTGLGGMQQPGGMGGNRGSVGSTAGSSGGGGFISTGPSIGSSAPPPAPTQPTPSGGQNQNRPGTPQQPGTGNFPQPGIPQQPGVPQPRR